MEGIPRSGNGNTVVFPSGEGDEILTGGGIGGEDGKGFCADIVNYDDSGFQGALGFVVVDDTGDEGEVGPEDRCGRRF